MCSGIASGGSVHGAVNAVHAWLKSARVSNFVFRLLTSLTKNSKTEAFSLLLDPVRSLTANGSRGDLVSSYLKYAQVFCISPGDPFAAGWHTEAKSKENAPVLEFFCRGVRRTNQLLETRAHSGKVHCVHDAFTTRSRFVPDAKPEHIGFEPPPVPRRATSLRPPIAQVDPCGMCNG